MRQKRSLDENTGIGFSKMGAKSLFVDCLRNGQMVKAEATVETIAL